VNRTCQIYEAILTERYIEMPTSCQGLPNGPCPYDCCDHTVKFSIYDLFLCPRCIRIRENQQPLTTNGCADNMSTSAVPPKKGRKAKNTGVVVRGEQQLTHSSTSVADDLTSRLATHSTPATTDDANNSGSSSQDGSVPRCSPNEGRSNRQGEMPTSMVVAPDIASMDQPCTASTSEITFLRQVITDQHAEIQKLKQQLNYVLSFLGITDSVEDVSEVTDPLKPRDQPPITLPVETLGLPAQGDGNDRGPWNEVTSKRQLRLQRQSIAFQQSVVAAVYVDQSLKRRRESSLIVNGLEPAVGRPDDQLFAALCSTELSVRPDVVSAKRLGHSQVGKIQPLLVYLKQADQAQQLINSAKRLRHSANPAVRDKVFINPNLTKAEAAAAFQVRSLRRQAQQRQQRALNDEDNNREGSKSSTDLGSLESSRFLRPITSDVVNALPLNPSADVFKPSVASSD
jgi:hypothetical protein